MSLVVLTALCGVVAAAEVPAPSGTSLKFDAGSPTSGKYHINGAGEYAVPKGWSRGETKLRIYEVKADGTKGAFVREAGCTAANTVWQGGVTGLTPDTEYWVEARMKVTKDGILETDYAYVNAEAKKKTTK